MLGRGWIGHQTLLMNRFAVVILGRGETFTRNPGLDRSLAE